MVSAHVILRGEKGIFLYLLSWDFTTCLSVMKDLLCLSCYFIPASLAGVNNRSVTCSSCVLKVSGRLDLRASKNV